MVGGQLRKVRVATGEIIEDVGTIEKIDGAHVPIPDGHVWDVKKGAILDPDGFV